MKVQRRLDRKSTRKPLCASPALGGWWGACALLVGAGTLICNSPRAENSTQQETDDLYLVKATYSFDLTRGKGVDVCEAYLKRLRTTEFKAPPFCDIPESNATPGFAKLNRVPLTPEDLEGLYQRIYTFTRFDHQVAKDRAELPNRDLSVAQLQFGDFWRAWRYNPPISIENNGKPTNLVIWQDPLGEMEHHCGDETREGPAQSIFNWRIEQLGFILTDDGHSIDEKETRRLFGKRSGHLQFGSPGSKVIDPGFAFIADQVGIFEYHGLYYIEGFFDDTYGDYEGRRSTYGEKRLGEVSLENTLAVLLHKSGKTTEVCEYQMIERRTEKPIVE